jgi:hypothetical protein
MDSVSRRRRVRNPGQSALFAGIIVRSSILLVGADEVIIE